MNKITNITRNEIFNLLFNGYEDCDILGIQTTYKINYFGTLDVVTFLSILYDLKQLPSLDNKYTNAEGELIFHTRSNHDYKNDFILTDKRFNLKEASDKKILEFLCAVFHPEVRVENGHWQEIYSKINEALIQDGFELYPSSKISGRDTFGWRFHKPAEPYLPFSLRHKHEIGNKTIKFTIPMCTREQIYSQILKFDTIINETTETGFIYNDNAATKLLQEIATYYEPKSYNTSNQYVTTEELNQFILKTSPYCIFDAIEIYSSMIDNNNFDAIINQIFKNERLQYMVEKGRIVSSIYANLKTNIGITMESGVKELLQKATEYYNKGNKEVAVEKLWDAYERLKTTINHKNKKQSTTDLILKISKGIPEYTSLFETEFASLTKIGNDFRIRHHEVNKIEINDEYFYEYLYLRCVALINIALNSINE